MTNRLVALLGESQTKLLVLLRRGPQTIAALAAALRLTDNAVRMHVAGLRRDGLVTDVGTLRDTGGKPARLYGLTGGGEELFPKAYALVLGELVREIVNKEGKDRAAALLEAVGRRVAAERMGGGRLPGRASVADRVAAAASALRDLGADLDAQREGNGWRLQGYGCPLSGVTAEHAEVCALAQGIVEAITGRTVRECCDRSNPDRPRCAFAVS